MLMIGAFLGWQGAAFALFAGAAQGLVVAIYGLLAGKRLAPEPPPDEAPQAESDEHREPGSKRTAELEPPSEPPAAWVGHMKLPFGPFLALGALEYLFFGDTLLGAWLGLFENVFSG
jgi:leader peptidase (prepilin peptidase)/N-methyltransferase